MNEHFDNKSQNILVITREYPPNVLGGISYHLSKLYDRIVARGHSVTVLAGICRETSEADITPAEEITVHRIPYGTRRGHHVLFPLLLTKFLRDFEVSHYDAAITHTPLPFNLNIPTVGKFHDCAPAEREANPKRGFAKQTLDFFVDPTRKLVNQRAFKTMDCAIFNSKLCRSAWSTRYELPAATSIHYNGVDKSVFHPVEVSDNDYLLFVGNSERKGFSEVIDFAPDSPWPIRVVGADSVASSHVTAIGRVEQARLAELYSGAIATIHPARFEAFGNVVLESLACGTPVITTSYCGASEVLTDSCGIVTDDLEEGVKEIHKADSQACLETAQRYTWSNVALQTLQTIQRVSKS